MDAFEVPETHGQHGLRALERGIDERRDLFIRSAARTAGLELVVKTADATLGVARSPEAHRRTTQGASGIWRGSWRTPFDDIEPVHRCGAPGRDRLGEGGKKNVGDLKEQATADQPRIITTAIAAPHKCGSG